MPQPPSTPGDPKTVLWLLRVIWAAVVINPILLGAVLAALGPPTTPIDATVQSVFIYISVASLLVLTPLGYFIRNQTYKAHWRGEAITPTGYMTGNIVLLAMMEGVAIAGIVFAFIAGTALPFAYVVGGALLVNLINFPTGRPMEPTEPILGERGGR